MQRVAILILLMLSACRVALAAPSAYDERVKAYVEWRFLRNSSSATSDGDHRYDGRMKDVTAAGLAAETAELVRFRASFEALDRSQLTEEERADLELVLGDVRSRLLDLQQLRVWWRDPDRYSAGASEAVFSLMARKFAPPEQRLASVISREKEIPARLEAARKNLENPPRIYTEIAIEQLPGIVSFFDKDVPLAFKDVKDAGLLSEFKTANDAAIAALRSYGEWLKSDLLPRSKGDFRLGADNYRKKLLYDEMVDIPLERLLDIGEADLRRNQARFREVAAAVDAKATPAEVLARTATDHPKPADLLQSFRDVLDGLSSFIKARRILDIPSPVMPILQETPPFERALTMASMDTPGPLEHVAKEAFFNVTLPEPGWAPKEVAEHMAGFTYGTIISTAVHEAYPGHYVQFLWVQRAPTLVRKLFGCSSNAEGWAHYCEQMMLDEGYGGGDPKLRLGQLQDALLRNARFIVGIKMHTGQMTFEQGVDYFVKEGYQSRANGLRETKRGTSDPTYLYYTLGKLEILKLRDDYKTLRGAEFTLQQFHDRFLGQGYPPIKIIRKFMLGNDSPVL